MPGSRKDPVDDGRDVRANQKNRTRSALLGAAAGLLRTGWVPTVAEAAKAAAVSPATAYRYFPSQSALIQAVVHHVLAPVLPPSAPAVAGPEEWVEYAADRGFAQVRKSEAALRAALRLSLQQWERRQRGEPEGDPPIVRGRSRMASIDAGMASLAGEVEERTFQRLRVALSLLFGVEGYLVMKDIWGLSDGQARDVLRWAGRALVRAAREGQGSDPEGGSSPRPTP